MEKAKRSVLLGLRLLGATNAPKAAYENVPGGEAAWVELVRDGLVVMYNDFYVVSRLGHEALKMWETLSYREKLLVLEGETTVLASLLIENETLAAMLKDGQSKEACITFINENW